MIHELAKYWWLIVLRGVLAVLFAVVAFLWPAITLAILVIFLGAYLLVDGLFALIHGFRVMKTDSSWWGFVLLGLAGIAAGLVCLFMPGITALFLVTLVALWSLVTGILEIVIAIRLRKELTGEWMLIVAGIFSVIFGILLFMQPLAGVVVISWWLGVYALFLGIFLLSVGFRLKKVSNPVKHH
ncbi:HdeD family acid-resistance protein [Chitinophaga sp. GCM10012297]|uniref:HdeD family acid-resistance protein n=1 Tax=Chitinophaga chungangae TaxID=2821488 RepID=A0ABS3YKD1_9BACT|nr:HdeD family acid-resistance protein [Chitinophaga chungangae]MBO9155147.1 HdeD family acid-resistance protein [Chitinophaga chungangae]